MQFPTVYVIIVWYNGAKWVKKNIESLINSKHPVKIVCIDNGSTDQTVALLQEYKKHVHIVQSPENLGFGKANNIGIEAALKQNADYVFLLNQDTWVYPETIGNLLKTAKNNPEYGIVSPIHLAPNESDFDANFKTYLSKATDTNSELSAVPFVNAAAWLIPKKALKKVSYFEPLFGHYGEDRNFVDRMIFHAFKIGIDHSAKITHDRVITRNFNKDLIQSEYKILATLLNPNLTEQQALQLGFKNVLGLPKYFYKFYGLKKSVSLFLKLRTYYSAQIKRWKEIQHARSLY